MTSVQDIFKTRADNFGETMIGRAVSFKIPEYQRPYDWDQNNVQRFLQDCLILQLQKCGEEFQAGSVMAAPGRCLVPPSPPGPPQH